MDLTKITKESTLEEKNKTLLYIVEKTDSPELVKKMIDIGADINAKVEEDNIWKGFNPLSTAIWHGNFKIAKFLMELKAESYIKEDVGFFSFDNNGEAEELTHVLNYLNRETNVDILEDLINYSKENLNTKNKELGLYIFDSSGKRSIFENAALHHASAEVLEYIFNHSDLVNKEIKDSFLTKISNMRVEDYGKEKISFLYKLYEKSGELENNDMLLKIIEREQGEHLLILKEIIGEEKFENERIKFIEKFKKHPVMSIFNIDINMFSLIIKPENYLMEIHETEFIKEPFYLSVLNYSRGDILEYMLKNGLSSEVKFNGKSLITSLLEASESKTFKRRFMSNRNDHTTYVSFNQFFTNREMEINNFDKARMLIYSKKENANFDIQKSVIERLAMEDKNELSQTLKGIIETKKIKPRL